MKIAIVENSTSGHRETYYKEFTNSIKAMGHDVVMFTPTHINDIAHENLRLRQLHPFQSRDYFKKKWILLRNSIIRLQNLKTIKKMVSHHNPDLVFFPYLDDFLPTLSTPYLIERLIPYQWSGLLVQSHFHTYKWWIPDLRPALRHNKCRGIGVLNEYSIEELKDWQKKILRFPDFVDLSNPNKQYPLLKKVLSIANGRKIVSLIGSINRRKGIDLLARTIRHLPANEYFFVIAGKSSLSKEETIALKAIAVEHKNLLISLEKIPTEADFNALIAHSHLIFAVYQNFSGSSNLQTKAAFFKKPILVAKSHCMGKRVEMHGTGIAINETNENESKNAIIKLCSLDIDDSKYETYTTLHHIDLLSKSLELLIS